LTQSRAPYNTHMKTILIFLLLSSVSYAKEYEAILTAYCPCSHCCSYFIDKDGVPRFNLRPTVKKVIGQTACGAMAREGLTLAMPSCFKFGTHVYQDGKLLGVCEDRGGAIRVRENKIKIDVYFESHQDALAFGVKHVTVEVSQP